ncbi:hypothetical protein [Streptosporangium sandarakinum]|uniref:hypothetical protein n=1 Tax=Streptosporangium sandarakinum TaxID=1260955 RepID=UPI0037B00E51
MSDLLADHTTLRVGGPVGRLLTHTDPTAWPDLARTVVAEPAASPSNPSTAASWTSPLTPANRSKYSSTSPSMSTCQASSTSRGSQAP